MDNMVAVNYINKMGGRITILNELCRQLWFWCKNRHIWLTSCHLPGVENIEADRLSRSLNIDMEWKLNDDIFQLIDILYGPHEVDVFVSSCKYLDTFPTCLIQERKLLMRLRLHGKT
jgi:hypothetical protein